MIASVGLFGAGPLVAATRSKRIIPARNISRRAMLGGQRFFDNTVAAFNVQLWAQTSLALLYENMVMAHLVYRDFEDEIAAYGDTVNTRKPGQFKAKRKTNADSVTVQDANATNIPVRLNQTWHVSYLIKDGEESISFKSLIDEFLRPAMIAEARGVDLVLSTQVYQFMANGVGGLLTLSDSNAKDRILDSRKKMNDNNAWVTDRNMVLTSATETELLRVEQFTDANRVGDDGTALREASLGRKLGFDILMAQNQPSIRLQPIGTGGNTIKQGAINNAAGYPAGTTSFTVDGFSSAIGVGTWITIAGDDTPLQVASTTGGAAPTAIVIVTGSKYAVVDNAVVTVVNPASVSGSYTVDSVTGLGYAKEITISGVSNAPQVGQLVSFGTNTTNIYGIVDVNGTTGITLDRPIEANLSNSDAVNFGPAGDYNFPFHPNAIAMVSRPLASPRPGTGALSARAEWESLSIRVTITYDGNKQGHLVTIDMLMGVKILDQALGAVMYG